MAPHAKKHKSHAHQHAERQWVGGRAMTPGTPPSLEMLSRRMKELESALDAEKGAELAAAGLAVLGVVAGAAHKRSWLGLLGVATALLAQQKVSGWSPAVTAMQGLGLKTRKELELEREAVSYALRALGRGSA